MLVLHKNKKTILSASIALALVIIISVFAINKNMIIDNTYAREYTYPIPDGYTTIVDQNFYECVAKEFKTEFPSEEIPTTGLTDEQLGKITKLLCDGYFKSDDERITDTTGVEKMVGLTVLSLSGNHIKIINLENNILLKELFLDDNDIEVINLENNILLEGLFLDDNDIEELDVSNHPSLKAVTVRYNDLVSVSVAGDSMLRALDAFRTKGRLSSVDVSGCSNLEYLDISNSVGNSSMTELDLSDNVELVTLKAYGNNLSDEDIVANNTKLQNLYLGYDDAAEGDFLYNNFSRINLSNNDELKKVYLTSNKLRSIDVGNLTNLEELGLAGNLLEELNVSNNIKLTRLTIGQRYVCSNLWNLSELHGCRRHAGNSIGELNLLNNTQLNSLSIAYNEFRALDLSSQANLVYLDASSNHLNENTLRLPEDDNIKTLWLENNDFSDFPFLMEHLHNLDLSGNDFMAYRVKNLPSLDALYVGNNGLAELDIADAVSLKGLDATGTSLESIDVSKNSELQDLRIDDVFVDVNVGHELKNGNMEYDFSSLKFVGACNTIDDSDVYTYDASLKLLSVNNIADFPGYVQTVGIDCVEYPNSWWVTSELDSTEGVGGQRYKIRLVNEQKIDEDDVIVPNTAVSDIAVPDTGMDGLKEDGSDLGVISGWVLLSVVPMATMVIVVRRQRRKRSEIEAL